MNILFHIYPVLILANNVLPISIPIFSDIQDIISLAHDLSDISSGRVPLIGGLFGTTVDPVQAKLDGLSTQISEMTKTINVRMDKLMAVVLNNVPKTIQFNSIMSKLISYVTRIDELFEDYQYYVKEKGMFTQFTIDDFSRVTTSHKYGDVQNTLRQMYALLIPGQLNQENQSLLELMVFVLEDAVEIADRCNKVKTPQHQLYDIYEVVILSEVKSFVMASYGYGLLSIYQNVSFAHELDKSVAQLIQRCEKYLSFINEALKKLTREVFLCDPSKHVEGETYFKITAIRSIIAQEFMITQSEDCPESCSSIDSRTYYRNYNTRSVLGKDKWTPMNPCRGRMNECEDIGYAAFCEMPETSYSRYTWVENDGGLFGEKNGCSSGRVSEVFKFKPWYECSTCFCSCSEENKDTPAIRTLSLRPQMADIANNMVVTGVRFELKDNMVHIQIEEGKLLSAGRIQKNSSRLVELEDFKYLDNVDGGGWAIQKDDKSVPLEQGKDYSFVKHGQRDINLDNIYSQEPGYVVTGLRLARDPTNAKAVQLDVHMTPFNFSSGKLVPTGAKPSKWIKSQDMPGRKDAKPKDFHLANRENPTNSDITNLPDSEDFMQTWFVPTEKWKDIGQNTVPFLDRQLVAAYPRVPLEGVAIYHRGTEKSGGFLAFKLYTFDISQYLQPTLTPENLKRYKDVMKCDLIDDSCNSEDWE